MLPDSPFLVQLRGVGHSWLLLAARAARVRVNGELLGLGCRVLRDRDEVVFGKSRSYFSTEKLACVEAFPGAAEKVFCVRCKQPIESGSPAVQCPGCQRWYHESIDLPCWTYGEVCGLCPHPTALDAGFRWEPLL